VACEGVPEGLRLRPPGDPISPSPHTTGLAYALAAYLAWGLSPIYFKALRPTGPLEILSWRVVASVALLGAMTVAMGRSAEVARSLSDRRRALTFVVTTLLISVNWLLYIWSVNTGHLLEASMGYFMNPLVTILLGVIFLKEGLDRRQAFAVALAAVGVAWMVVAHGRLPWISLKAGLERRQGLAVALASVAVACMVVAHGLLPCFSLTVTPSSEIYTLLRKQARIDAVAGLLVETSFLAPLALAWLGWLWWRGEAHFGNSTGLSLLLLSAGAVTALPLVWFALGVHRLRLSTVGLLQYVAPTLQFTLAVVVYREPFGSTQAVTFAFIWSGLALYTADAIGKARRREPVPAVEPLD
jgi:chloramphenicol-sensitive protein RarD